MLKKSLCLAALSAAFLAGGCGGDGGDGWFSSKKEGTARRIETTALPAAVEQAFRGNQPQATINSVREERFDNGRVHYHITFTDRDGKRHESTYNARGEKQS